jgi:hypothetical protein
LTTLYGRLLPGRSQQALELVTSKYLRKVNFLLLVSPVGYLRSFGSKSKTQKSTGKYIRVSRVHQHSRFPTVLLKIQSSPTALLETASHSSIPRRRPDIGEKNTS